MACRKWFVRGIVTVALVALAVGGVAYQHWTSPVTVRQLVLEKLKSKFPGALVTLESASLRLLGGIEVRELRLTRRDDPENVTFLYTPCAILYHDKEQFLQGRLVLRKIELRRPQLRIWRNRDGRLSLEAGLIAPPPPGERLPTFLITEASVTLEDRQAPQNTAPLEIREASVKLLNDPMDEVSFEGSAASDLGPLTLEGHWNRQTNRCTLTLDASSVPVGPSLFQRLAGFSPGLVEKSQGLSGTARIQATIGVQPGSDPAVTHDVSVSLVRGRFQHRDLPLPLEDLKGALRCLNNHLPYVKLEAKSGSTTLRGEIRDLDLPLGGDAARPFDVERIFRDADVTISQLTVQEGLLASPFFSRFSDLYHLYQPSGPVTITLQGRPETHKPWRKRVHIEPHDVRCTFAKFIYPLDRIKGSLEFLGGSPRGDVWTIDLTGHTGDRPVRIKGEITGRSPTHVVDIGLWCDNVPIDEKLFFALKKLSENRPTDLHKLARSFAPEGLVDLRARISRPAGVPRDQYANHFLIRFHDANLCYDRFRYRLDNVSGLLELFPDQAWEFRDFRGTHGTALVTAKGSSRSREEGVHATITGRNVAIDDALREALWPDVQRALAVFRPEGSVDLDSKLTLPYLGPDKEARPEIELTVRPRGCTIRPEFFPFSLFDLRGRLHYARNGVELHELTARHGETTVRVDRGVVLIREGGGFTADLTHLHAEALRVDEDLLKALRVVRDSLSKGVAALEVQGPFDLHTRLYVDVAAAREPPRIFWDGGVVLRDAVLRAGVPLEGVTGVVTARGWFGKTRIENIDGTLDLATLSVFGQPIRHVRGALLVTEDEPDVLKFPGLMAQYFGGQVYGPVRVEFSPRLRYEMNFTAGQIHLEEFARHNFQGRRESRDMMGLVGARLSLHGEGNEVAGLRGSGRVDVPNGKMANLPKVVDLLKFLGLRLPDRTAFEEAHATFEIEGFRARVRQLELFGNAISLRGHGDLALDGSDLNLDCNVDWARLGQVLPPGIRDLPRGISDQLLKIEVRGRLDEMRFRAQPVPGLTEPFRRLFGGEESETDETRSRWN